MGMVTKIPRTSRNGSIRMLQTKEDHHLASFFDLWIMVPFFSPNSDFVNPRIMGRGTPIKMDLVAKIQGTSRNGSIRKLQTKGDHQPAAFFAPGIVVPFFHSNYAIFTSKRFKKHVFSKTKTKYLKQKLGGPGGKAPGRKKSSLGGSL